MVDGFLAILSLIVKIKDTGDYLFLSFIFCFIFFPPNGIVLDETAIRRKSNGFVYFRIPHTFVDVYLSAV